MQERCARLTREILAGQCRTLGIVPGDTVMVHASLRSVGPILGGIDQLIGAILDAVGPDGTMLVYVGCESPFDDVGRGLFPPEDEAFILEHCPPFDPGTGRANRTFGAFAELSRTYPGARCSEAVDGRMAAIGAKASWLVDDCPMEHDLGRGSPLERLCRAGGKLMLIGSDHDNVTLLHYAEAIAPIPDKRRVRIRVPLLRDGTREWLELEQLDSSVGIVDWPEAYFATLVGRFLAERGISPAPIGGAATYLLDAQSLVDFAIPHMVREAAALTR